MVDRIAWIDHALTADELAKLLSVSRIHRFQTSQGGADPIVPYRYVGAVLPCNPVRLLVPQSFNRIKTRGANGGHHTADQSHGGQNQSSCQQRARSNDQPDVTGFRILRHGAV